MTEEIRMFILSDPLITFAFIYLLGLMLYSLSLTIRQLLVMRQEVAER